MEANLEKRAWVSGMGVPAFLQQDALGGIGRVMHKSTGLVKALNLGSLEMIGLLIFGSDLLHLRNKGIHEITAFCLASSVHPK